MKMPFVWPKIESSSSDALFDIFSVHILVIRSVVSLRSHRIRISIFDGVIKTNHFPTYYRFLDHKLE